jgi:hypothetical protein
LCLELLLLAQANIYASRRCWRRWTHYSTEIWYVGHILPRSDMSGLTLVWWLYSLIVVSDLHDVNWTCPIVILHIKNWNFLDILPCNLLSIYSPFIKRSRLNYSTLFISHVCFQFRVQDHIAFKLTYTTCTTFDFDILHMQGKLSK